MHPRKIVDSIEYKPVTLIRGVTSDLNFQDWAKQFIELHQGRKSDGSGFPPGSYRRTVQIDHLDRAGRIVKSYILINAYPTEYQPASDFSADGDDMISMEKLVLSYEGFEVKRNSDGSNNPFDISDIVKRGINRLF